jgi:excisionase family DNA binding protein
LGLNTIYSLLDSGELPFIRVGNRRYVKEADFDQLLQRTGSEDAA